MSPAGPYDPSTRQPGADAEWLDISLPVGPESVAWSGLATPQLSFEAQIGQGSAVNVGRLACSLHTGTHADAPYHVDPTGRQTQALDPSAFMGPAWVVRLDATDAIRRDQLEARVPGDATRILIALSCQYDGRQFPERIPHVSAEAAAWLAGRGTRLVGVNVPSVDPLDSQAMLAHKALFEAGTSILENLNLADVPEGRYWLAAPPLAVIGGDAAPCRALLTRWSGTG